MSPIDEELEYQERWSYVKHSESVRYRAARWYFTVVAALLTVAYSGTLQLDPLLARPVILVFLTLYTVATALYLVGLKLSYREHVDRIRELDDVGTEHRDQGGGAFSFYLYSIALVGGFVAFAAGVEIARDPGPDGLPGILGFVLAGIAGIAVAAGIGGSNRCRLREGGGE